MKVLWKRYDMDGEDTCQVLTVEEALSATLDAGRWSGNGAPELGEAFSEISDLTSILTTVVGVLADKGLLGEADVRKIVGRRCVSIVGDNYVHPSPVPKAAPKTRARAT